MELVSSDRRRLFRSTMISFTLWFAIGLAFVFIPHTLPPVKEPVFPPIRIILKAPVSVTGTKAQSPAVTPATEPTVAKAEPAKTAPAKTVPAKKAPAKVAPAKTATTKSSIPTNVVPKPSAGLGIPNFSEPVTSGKVASGDAETLDFSSTKETDKPVLSSVPPSGVPVAEFEGKAAVVAKNTDTGVVKSKNSASGGLSSAPASAETKNELQKIAGQAKTGSGGSTQSSTPGANTAKSGSSPSTPVSNISGLTFETGKARVLVFPADPAIKLPPNLAALVNSNRTITVRFTVKADGTVPGGLVFFSPEAQLPPEIRDYLRSVFSKWQFEKGTQDGQARFLYSIQVQ